MGYGVYVGYGVGVAIGNGAGVSNGWLPPLQPASATISTGSNSSGMHFNFIASPIITRQGDAVEQGDLVYPASSYPPC